MKHFEDATSFLALRSHDERLMLYDFRRWEVAEHDYDTDMVEFICDATMPPPASFEQRAGGHN